MNTEIEKLFVSWELAKLIDHKKFNEECLAYFDENGEFGLLPKPLRNTSMLRCITAPLYQQVETWLAKNHKIRFAISIGDDGFYSVKFMRKGINRFPEEYSFSHQNEFHEEKKQALSKAIEEALTFIK